MSSNLYKSTGGFDANNQRIANLADPSAQGDAVNLKVFDQKNTVQPYLTNRPYDVDFVVEYNYQLWKCIASTSGAFDKTKWRVINGPENWIRITNTYTAANGDALLVDTTSAAITVTLPASPKSGDYINITDAGSAATNAITIARNGSTIGGVASNISVTEPNTQLRLVYLNGTWQLNIVRPDRVRFVTGAVTVEPNIEHMVDAASSFTITLPSNPKTGDWVGVTDRAGAFGTYPITVSGNSKQIAGASTFVMNQKKASVQFMYNGSQWVVYNRTGNALLAHNNLSELEDPAAARTALQLDTMATKKAGTGATEFRNNSENDGAYQPKDATLTALAALTTALNKLVYATGPDQFALTDFTAQARTFLAAATQAAQRSSMGLGDAATKNVGLNPTDVLGVGSFGLGGDAEYTTDLDTLTKTGFYTSLSGTIGHPSSMNRAAVVHFEHDSTYMGGMQIAVSFVGTLYIRNRASDGTWSAWGEFATTGSFGTAAYKNTGVSLGNVMEVGAFGLGWAPTMIDDFNNGAYPTGFYRFEAATPNRPSAIPQGYVSVIWENNNNFQQIAYHSMDNIIVRRVCSGGVFGPWGHIHTNVTISSAITATVGAMIGANGDQTKPMGVGAFGLGSANRAPVVTDLNSVTTGGMYSYDAATTNAPTSQIGALVVIAYSGATTQIAIDRTNQTIYTRTLTTSSPLTWSPWRENWHSGNTSGKSVVRELVPIWTGSVGSAGVVLTLNEPIQVNDEIVLKHNDAQQLLSHPLVMENVTSGRVYAWSFSSGGGTTMTMGASGGTLTTSAFTSGYGLTNIYKVKYKLA